MWRSASASGQARRHASTGWPLPEVSYRRLYLAAHSGALIEAPPASGSCCRYDALAEDAAAIFDLRFEAHTDIVGHCRLHLFVSTDEADDLDLFVALEKLDAGGQMVGMTHYAVFENGPVALGWLRVSHRELDPDQTTAFLPVLAHRSERKLVPGQIVEADIEILPSGTHFEAGESLRLRIQGRDVFHAPKPLLYARHEDTVNRGTHCIWTGAPTASWLQVPVLPRT